jgi:heterodisulfide reductase subunit A
MVIGGGIAGIQASLDLAGMGVETYLVERAPSIGGRMAQLDKTFPTNDCAMCILSPKLVEVGSHPNIHIIANAEVQRVEGEAGDFRVSVLKKARYVDEARCTGCGVCMSKCPVRIPDEYNKGLSKTKCIRIPFPQAVPAVPLIDRENCLFFKRGRCKLCEKNCEEKVIDYEQKDELLDLDVGSIVLAAGSGEFDARLKEEYAYGTSPNVMSSIEFERWLAASGPTQGHVVRPSDQQEPKRVAFLQCVGSRDRQVGHEYCSAICCMQAAKDAVILSEHLKGVEATIFNMDTRAQGKDFDRFIERAQDQYGVRVVRGRISSVEIDPANENPVIRHVPAGGGQLEEEFDLVVLSVGLHSTEGTKELADVLGVKLDESGFAVAGSFDPVATARPGVFGCGTITGPKDIPETVVEASGAACSAASVMAELPPHFVETEYPDERDIGGEPLRAGVFVCRCGINIAATVDVPAVVELAKALPGVAHAQEFTFACAGDSQITIADVIKEKGLNRVVVSACTPRTHEPLFQKTLQTAGLNPYLFEFANIREHCSWVHQKEPERATEKAKGLVRMAVAKAAWLEPLSKTTLDANRDALVIGGGVAGMTAALELAKQGSHVHLVEMESALGGNFLDVRFTMDGGDAPALLSSLVDQVNAHEGIDVHLGSLVEKVDGFVGNFRSTIASADGAEGEKREIEHGAVIVATGARELDTTEYMRGSDPRVVTQKELELALGGDGDAAPDLDGVRSAVFIQCVGSRDEERPYCSRICCNMAIKNALKLKGRNPEANVHVLYRDVRAYGLSELRYREARERGVIFIRYEPESPPAVAAHNGALRVRVDEPILGRRLAIDADLVALAPAITADPGNKTTAQMLKVPLNDDGFFLEAHVKLRPVDFATDGVFVCGLAHYPKDASEAIAQAKAAAGRALAVLSRGRIEADGKVSRVKATRCEACGACVSVCAYGAIEIDEAKNVAVVNEAVCKGCGACAATCRSSAIDLGGFRDEQVVAALQAVGV